MRVLSIARAERHSGRWVDLSSHARFYALSRPQTARFRVPANEYMWPEEAVMAVAPPRACREI